MRFSTFEISQRCWWKYVFEGVMPCLLVTVTDVSKDYIDYLFEVKLFLDWNALKSRESLWYCKCKDLVVGTPWKHRGIGDAAPHMLNFGTRQKQNVHCHVHENTLLNRVVSQLNPVHILQPLHVIGILILFARLCVGYKAKVMTIED
jgi:hypothetical protein